MEWKERADINTALIVSDIWLNTIKEHVEQANMTESSKIVDFLSNFILRDIERIKAEHEKIYAIIREEANHGQNKN